MKRAIRRTAGITMLAATLLLAMLPFAPVAMAGTCYSSSSSTVTRSTSTDRLTSTVYFTTRAYCAGSYFQPQSSSVSKIVVSYSNTYTGITARNYLNAAAVHDRYAGDGPYCTSPLGAACWSDTSSRYCVSGPSSVRTCPMTRSYYPSRNGAAVWIPYNDQNVVRVHCVCGGLGFNWYNQYNRYTGFIVRDLG